MPVRPFTIAAVPGHFFSTVVVGLILTANTGVYACNNQSVTGMTGSPSGLQQQTEHELRAPSRAISGAIYDIARALNELQAGKLTGPVLESVLVQSHKVAKKGSLPIPPDIRRQLTGYSTEDSMNRVRYRVGASGSLNLATLSEQVGLADAVTLIDVIVFRDAIGAATVSLWAHELTHVDQFREWGVHGFAVRYAQNWQAVEAPAYSKGDGFAAWLLSRQTANVATSACVAREGSAVR
ncbi:eCIS core domain-containing protein [Rhizobium mesoamericanum]|uniref:eCIS core domain-containing protein n=1 Tax=Rhizobium mesoamericanum STM3625 TaxID=1211777 RepID=K0Q0V1_9HYPH|nr:DUF4157 domain-containing protein [Rhizobium mesoamericanum]CCM75994.1 hypothetical protein BN77_3181 [Rhizobium mesoamericanum STM3625]